MRNFKIFFSLIFLLFCHSSINADSSNFHKLLVYCEYAAKNSAEAAFFFSQRMNDIDNLNLSNQEKKDLFIELVEWKEEYMADLNVELTKRRKKYTDIDTATYNAWKAMQLAVSEFGFTLALKNPSYSQSRFQYMLQDHCEDVVRKVLK